MWGVVVAAWLDLTLFPPGGDGRRRRAQIRELEKLGRCSGRWVTADGFIPFSMTGVYFDSNKASVRWGFSNSR